MDEMKQLYEKVAADSELQVKFNEIMAAAEKVGKDATGDNLVAFAKDLGYDVTLDEMQEFFRAQTEAHGEFSDSELDQVAGGKTGLGIAMSIISVGLACAIITVAGGEKECENLRYI